MLSSKTDPLLPIKRGEVLRIKTYEEIKALGLPERHGEIVCKKDVYVEKMRQYGGRIAVIRDYFAGKWHFEDIPYNWTVEMVGLATASDGDNNIDLSKF